MSSALRPTPEPGGQGPCFYVPQWQGGPVTVYEYFQAPGSLLVAFYDSQGHGGGILTCLHTGTPNMIRIYIYIFYI
jgi:hypothetical protein